MTSSAFSNMLSDLRNCLRGLAIGFEFFLTCPRGEAFRLVLASPAKGCLGRGGSIRGLLRSVGFSWGGESSNASDRFDKEDDAAFCTPIPLPNLNGNGWPSVPGLCGMELVETPLVRVKEGRRGPDFLLLYVVSRGPLQLTAALTLGGG